MTISMVFETIGDENGNPLSQPSTHTTDMGNQDLTDNASSHKCNTHAENSPSRQNRGEWR
jgi:hypothetical protein